MAFLPVLLLMASIISATLSQSNCDNNDNCQYWAQEGYCPNNDWMAQNCFGSCNPDCQADQSDQCQGWAGYCNDDEWGTWMKQNCYTTCCGCSGGEDVSIESEFKMMFANMSSDVREQTTHVCGIDAKEEQLKKRSYTNIHSSQFWPNGEIPWSFVSIGDEYAKYAFHTDATVGLSKADVDTVMAAMAQIQAKTCLGFTRVSSPSRNQKWLFVARDAKHDDLSCQTIYIKNTYEGKDVKGLGDIYKWVGSSVDECFGGAYAFTGAASPQRLVLSQVRLNANFQGSIGLVVHELLHNLGLGHTQKRQDATEHIEILWNNIQPNNFAQYKPCIEANQAACSRYNAYGTQYDCNSIMHYEDTAFLTRQARNQGLKTMRPLNPDNCDLSTGKNRMTDADVMILKKMYCANSARENAIVSDGYPSNYANNVDKDYPISVEAGSVVAIWFTSFNLEAHQTCNYDWIQIMDGDGTVLLAKTCGTNLPARLTSRTRSITVKFHTDYSETRSGFRAEYEKASVAVINRDGVWGSWSAFSACSNRQDGKSACRKKKIRHCNDPPPSGNGRPCSGESAMFVNCVAADLTNQAGNPQCTMEGAWSMWSALGACSSSCTATRTRTCSNPAPYNDKDCEGIASESSACTGGDCSSNTEGIITSPNHPNEYPNDMDITFPLEVDMGSRIELTFTAFDVEPDTNCEYDYIMVQGRKYCGSTIPPLITSSGHELEVIFHSDYSVTHTGFSARWRKVAGGGSVGSRGTVTSPNYPSDYAINQMEEKVLEVASGSRIALTITDMDIEWVREGDVLTCPYDSLTIMDSNGSEIRVLCGRNTDKPSGPITSSGNSMTLVFKTDNSVNHKGYSASWEAV